MTPERWQQVKAVLGSALARSPGERAAFLDEACGADVSLRAEVESLIAYEQPGDSLSDSPAVPLKAYAGSSGPFSLATGPSGEEMGSLIGPYKIVRELGHGGMGVVYLAARADDEYRWQVAIKLIRRGMHTDFVFRRFRNERQILATLDHPNIARLLDGGTTPDGLPYLVMDYVRGIPIDEYCDQHALNTGERLKLFQQACAAIHYAHQRQVIHRDIKPGNILVTEEGGLKLLDFGIAKLLTPEMAAQTLDPTAPAMRLMTPAYASPEQIKGEPITTATDVYSLGVLLYELLTGHKPYRVKSQAPHEITQAVLEEEPVKPSTAITLTEETQSSDGSPPITLTPESVSRTREGSPDRLRHRLRGDLDNIVLTALRKDPQGRYASVEEFSEDIRRHMEGLPITARSDSLRYRAVKLMHRNRIAAAVIGISVLLLGPFALLAYLSASSNSNQTSADTRVRSVAVLPLKSLRNEKTDETLLLGLTATLVTRLGSLRSIVVLPMGAVSHLAQDSYDPVEIGRKVQVDAVLEGVIQRAENRLRINAHLLRVSDGALIWSGSFDESETDLLRLQDQLSLQVTESLVSSLTQKERELIAKRYTQNTEAFHTYWRGRFFLDKRNPEKAIPEFQRAINLDAGYALAYAGLADAYITRAAVTSDADAELYKRAIAATHKALELDPNLSDAHTSLARLKYYQDWDWEGAEQSFKRAIELDPDNMNAHQFYARLLATLGRYDEAIAEIQRARELDPRSADLAVPLFAILEKRGELDEALRVLQTSIDMDKESMIAQRAIGKIYLLKGEYARVIELGDELFPNPKEADFAWASMLATAYHRLGREDKAREMQTRLKRLAAKDPKALYFLVMHYSELGRTDEALAALQKCFELREERMIWTKDEPRFAGIKDDPGFHRILQRMNLAN